MFFNVKAPIWVISLLETSSIYICLLGVKVGKVTVQPFISSIHKAVSRCFAALVYLRESKVRMEQINLFHMSVLARALPSFQK